VWETHEFQGLWHFGHIAKAPDWASETRYLSHSVRRERMSALGHKRTNRRGLKSAVVRFGPKADKTERNWIVRLVPKDGVIGRQLVDS
jgi:hypothetical protein